MLFLFGISIGCSTPKRQAIFDMKVACMREGEKIILKLEQNKQLNGRTEFVYRVFYSPKLNSCVTAQYAWDNSNALSLRIVDALNQKEVWSASYHQYYDARPSIYPDAHTELDHQIESLGLE